MATEFSDGSLMHSQTHPTLGYLSNVWVSQTDMRISVDDLGFRQAVTVVERMRTYNGSVFQLDSHLDRWRHSLGSIEIRETKSRSELTMLVAELLARNESWVRDQGDVGITLFATPGFGGDSEPTLGLHLNSLDHAKIKERRELGQPLIITDVRQPHPDVWSRSIKVRCRLHYYRADMIARKSHPDAMGILVDDDGTITETSYANIAIVESGKIVSPLDKQVLGGITQSVVERIARDASIQWSKEPLSPTRMVAADEVLLMGTDTGLWFGRDVDKSLIHGGQPGPIYKLLANDAIWNG